MLQDYDDHTHLAEPLELPPPGRRVVVVPPKLARSRTGSKAAAVRSPFGYSRNLLESVQVATLGLSAQGPTGKPQAR